MYNADHSGLAARLDSRTLLRAIAAVAGTPPAIGVITFTDALLNQFCLACKRIPVMLLVTAPQSKLSPRPMQ